MLFPPELNAALGGASLQAPLAAPPPDVEYAETVEKGHGRIEVRRLALSREVASHLQWPGAARVCRIERTRERAGKTSCSVSWAVERTPAWLSRNRRLARDLEATVATTRTWLFIGSVQILLRRLTHRKKQ